MSNDTWAGMTPAAQAPVDPLAKIRADYLALSPEARIKARDAALVKWQEEQKALNAAKEAEAATRIAIVAMLFDPATDEGTETIELGNGWKIKAQKKLNYTLGEGRTDPNYNAVEAALNSIEGLDLPEAKFIADRLVKWKPDLVLKEYRLLGEEKFKPIRDIINRVLTTKPGMPTVELIPPQLPGMPKGKGKR